MLHSKDILNMSSYFHFVNSAVNYKRTNTTTLFISITDHFSIMNQFYNVLVFSGRSSLHSMGCAGCVWSSDALRCLRLHLLGLLHLLHLVELEEVVIRGDALLLQLRHVSLQLGRGTGTAHLPASQVEMELLIAHQLTRVLLTQAGQRPQPQEKAQP